MRLLREHHASTVPLVAMLHEAATVRANQDHCSKVIMVNGVSIVFYHAKVKRDVYVASPGEGMSADDKG